MLPACSIIKIIEYYISNYHYKEDIQRALIEFFDFQDVSEFDSLELDDSVEGLLNEWLVYDFKLSNGKTPLEDFCENNPCGLSSADMRLYQKLKETQQYCFFEVKEVKLDSGLTLYDLYTGETFEVKERSATHDLKPGFIFFNRTAKVNDHWELVGANSPFLPIKLSDRLRKVFRKGDKDKPTPKDAYHLLNRGGEKETDELMIDPIEAKNRLKNLMASTGLQKFITVDQIIGWIQDDGLVKDVWDIISLIFGLAESLLTDDSLNELMTAVRDVYNTTPQKELGDKTPQEKFSEASEESNEFVSDVRTIGGEKWLKKHDKATYYMHKNNFLKALKYFSETFEALLEEKTTRTDIYRIYGNKAVSHFAVGESEQGIKMVKLALDLNPNYDFAIKLKKQYEKNDFRLSMFQALLQTMNKEKKSGKKLNLKKLFCRPSPSNTNNDPSVKYYEYLKHLGINFATDKLTKSKITPIKLIKKYDKITK